MFMTPMQPQQAKIDESGPTVEKRKESVVAYKNDTNLENDYVKDWSSNTLSFLSELSGKFPDFSMALHIHFWAS